MYLARMLYIKCYKRVSLEYNIFKLEKNCLKIILEFLLCVSIVLRASHMVSHLILVVLPPWGFLINLRSHSLANGSVGM